MIHMLTTPENSSVRFMLSMFLVFYVYYIYFRNLKAAAAASKLLQSCPTLCDRIDSSPIGVPLPGILQARTLEWVAISISNAWKWKVKVKSLSRVWLLVTPWTAAYQAPSSMGFSRQEYWSGLPLPFLKPHEADIITFPILYIRKTCFSIVY